MIDLTKYELISQDKKLGVCFDCAFVGTDNCPLVIIDGNSQLVCSLCAQAFDNPSYRDNYVFRRREGEEHD